MQKIEVFEINPHGNELVDNEMLISLIMDIVKLEHRCDVLVKRVAKLEAKLKEMTDDTTL